MRVLQGGGDRYQQRGGDTMMMMQEESRLLYPPVGSTFDGHASRGVMAARSRGIDALADLQYRRPRPLQYGDMLQGVWGGEEARLFCVLVAHPEANPLPFGLPFLVSSSDSGQPLCKLG